MKKSILGFAILMLFTSGSNAQWETVYYPSVTSYLPWLNGVAFSDFENGIAVGDSLAHLVIMKTADNGTNWTKVHEIVSSGYASFNAVEYVNSDTVVCVGSTIASAVISRSTDGGNTWVDTYVSPAWLLALSFPTQTTGYACGSGGAIMKTVDGGSTWNLLSTPVSVELNSISFVNDQIGFACGDKTIIKTVDGGSTWTSFVAPFSAPQRSVVSFPSDDIGYCLMSDGISVDYLLKTTDQGTNWNIIDTLDFGPAYALAMSFPNDTVGYICGQFLMIKSVDGGFNWGVQTASSPGQPEFYDDLMDMYFLDQDTGFAVGNHQYYRITSAEFVGADNLQQSLPSVASVYPMPFSNQTIIELDLVVQHAYLKVYNCYGQLVQEILLPETSEFIYERDGLPAGIYFATISENSEVLTTLKFSIAD